MPPIPAWTPPPNMRALPTLPPLNIDVQMQAFQFPLTPLSSLNKSLINNLSSPEGTPAPTLLKYTYTPTIEGTPVPSILQCSSFSPTVTPLPFVLPESSPAPSTLQFPPFAPLDKTSIDVVETSLPGSPECGSSVSSASIAEGIRLTTPEVVDTGRLTASLEQPRQGESLVVLDQGDVWVSMDFLSKYEKKSIRKAAELSVFSTLQKDKVCYISASVNTHNAQMRKIQGRSFARLELIRKVRIGDVDVTQGYKKIKCAIADSIMSGDITFSKKDGRVFITHVSGKLVDEGVRVGMEVAECLDFNGPKKQVIQIENAKEGLIYRITLKFDFIEELAKYQDSQVFVKIQSQTSKGVLIEHWDHYLRSLPMHLNCLIKSNRKVMVFGLVFSSVELLSDDIFMEDFLDILEKWDCRISHYIKGGRLKADSANKLTVLIQMPTDAPMTEQKYVASRIMSEVYDMLFPITKDHQLKCVTAEIAEVVTLTKMACIMWTALMVRGVSPDYLWQMVWQIEDEERKRSTINFLSKISQTAPICHPKKCFESLDACLDFADECARKVHDELAHTWICDLVNQAPKSETDRQELSDGIAFLGEMIEAVIACEDEEDVEFLRNFLLGGKSKSELENDPSIYNKGRPKTWMECYKWMFNKRAKEHNLKELKKILRSTWGNALSSTRV